LGYGIINLKTMREAQLNEALGYNVVFFGEVHNVDWIIKLESEIVRRKAKISDIGFVGLELFNYRMDELINAWISEEITWRELIERYSLGKEGFPLETYKPLLETVKDLKLKVVGIMPPREEASKVARFGLEAIDDIEDLPVKAEEILANYDGYKDILLNLIPRSGPMAKLDPEKIILAQAFKDQTIAKRVSEANVKFGDGVVIAGYAHVEFFGSATTRFKDLSDSSVSVITSRNLNLKEAVQSVKKQGSMIEAEFLAYLV